MKKLNSEQIKNLKTFWDNEYIPNLKDKETPERVFFNGQTLEWLTWEDIGSPESQKLESYHSYFYYDTGDNDLTFEELCSYAEDYINTGKVAKFY